MINLVNHPYFSEYIDPKSGVKSYLLTEKISKMQQHFYFCNTSLTFDSKYLWIRCSNPPAMIQSLAVVSLDPEEPFIRQFQGAGSDFAKGNLPAIIPGTHDVIFGEGTSVYKVDIEGNIQEILNVNEDTLVNQMPGFLSIEPNFLKNKMPELLFTHATLSADHKTLAMDMYMGNKTYMCFGDLETGKIRMVDKFGGRLDHAQFSPMHPDLILLDQDGWDDYFSGEHFIFHNRIWIMDRNGTRFEPLLQNSWFGHDGSMICHDFWSLDGKVCYVDYNRGAFECDLDTREEVCVWPRPVCHCHTNADRSLWVADQTPYAWATQPCQMLFFDRDSGKEIEIFSAMPNPDMRYKPRYHIDPHPAFSEDGAYIISTTTVREGQVDVAITPVAPLLETCRKNGTVVSPK